MKLPFKKDAARIVRAAMLRGWIIERGGKHMKLCLGTARIPVACSPSDFRSLRNLEAQLLRAERADAA